MLRGTGLPILLAAIMSGQAPADPPVAPVVLERFKIATGGDFILVPVKIAGRVRMFVLDTGASHTFVDRSMLKSDSNSIEKVGTADQDVDIPMFPAPAATVGSLGFKGVDNVFGKDLAPLREACGLPIEGILGMDFLSKHVVRVDFDKGELSFLTATEPRSGTAVPLADGDDGLECPHIRGSVGGLEKIPFLVDSGWLSTSSGGLDSTTFGLLKKWKDLRIVGHVAGRGLSGDTSIEEGQSGALKVGDLRVERPTWTSGHKSTVGLWFLSRYVVTFDFPKGVMYARPGANVAKPDLSEASGVCVLYKNGAPVVGWVRAGSPGGKAGIKPGDVLVRVGDTPAGTGSLFELRKALCGRGQIPVTARRDGEELAFTLQVGQ